MQNTRTTTIYDARYKKAIQILIRARKTAGLSQSDLAEKIGLSQPDISKIERIERRLDITEFFDILRVVSNSDSSFFEQILREVNECHN